MRKNTGFTLIEVLLVIGIMAVLFTVSSINLLGAKNKASLTSTINVLVTDLSQQQLKAMVGDTEGRQTLDNYGIFLETNKYTLFHGVGINSDLTDFPVSLGDGIQITSTSFSGSNVVFTKGNGELSTGGIITVKNTLTDEQKTITLNQYGIITSIN